MSSLSVSDVATMLSVNEETVRRWIRNGKLKADSKRGRGGSSIELEDVITFVNIPPRDHMGALTKWLNAQCINYQLVEDTKEEKQKYAGKVAAVAATTALFPGAGVLAATQMLRCTPYSIKLADKSSDEGVAEQTVETIAISDTEDSTTKTEGESQSLFEENVTCDDAMGIDDQQSAKGIESKIVEEQMKLIKLKQDLAQIQAQISIAEGQIEYYKLLLNK